MSNKPFTTRLPEDSIGRLDEVATAAHTDVTKYAAMVLGRFSDLRPEFALDALAAIPKEFFRRGPGRPPAATARTQLQSVPAAQDGS